MDAREEMLARIRAALGAAGPDSAPPPRRYRTESGLALGELASLLADRLADYGARVRRCALDELETTVGAALAERGARRVVVPAGLYVPVPDRIERVVDDGLTPAGLDTVDGVITTAVLAIAETGTLVLDGSAGQGRRALSLVPDYHLCVLRDSQIVGLVTEAMPLLDPARPLTWISGPSATSDIELDRVQGVHGPRTLEVILAGEPHETGRPAPEGDQRNGRLMSFRHADEIWRDFPALVPCAMFAAAIRPDVSVEARLSPYIDLARSRLAQAREAELPEIQAWRRAFAQMGLKPTQYRCAAESLLRRFRKDGALPRLHPLVDLCNAVSLAFAIPVAAFDVSAVTGDIDVCYADGDEEYLTFAGELERPDPAEVIFRDQAGRAHARRWTNRQSGLSAVGEKTAAALIVAEALHETAASDVRSLLAVLDRELTAAFGHPPQAAVLSSSAPLFTFAPHPSSVNQAKPG